MRFLPLCLLAFCFAVNGIALAQEVRELPNYKTPSEAFEAFRNAHAKQEWLDAYRCLSDEALQDAVFEAYFSCSMALGERRKDVAKLFKKYGVDSSVVDAEYAKRIQSKNSNDASDRSDDDTRKILQEILFELLNDEREFCAATQGLLAKPDAIPVFGPLEKVQVDGDHAEGQAQTTRYVFMAEGDDRSSERKAQSP